MNIQSFKQFVETMSSISSTDSLTRVADIPVQMMRTISSSLSCCVTERECCDLRAFPVSSILFQIYMFLNVSYHFMQALQRRTPGDTCQCAAGLLNIILQSLQVRPFNATKVSMSVHHVRASSLLCPRTLWRDLDLRNTSKCLYICR